jgi:hypothetical protein
MDLSAVLKETWKQMAGAFLSIYPRKNAETFVISLPHICHANHPSPPKQLPLFGTKQQEKGSGTSTS